MNLGIHSTSTTMAGNGKQLSTIKYEDLLISSKFFYAEGSEDPDTIFPDETKLSRESQLDRPQDSHLRRNDPDQSLQHAAGGAASSSSKDGSRNMSSAALDVDVAMEAACGDPTFLVRINNHVP